MMRDRGAEKGFTLTELMIVVALVGVLSAVAIPNFMSYQARARRTEGYTNLAAIGRVQETFQATTGSYFGTDAPFPDWVAQIGDLSTRKMKWDDESETAWGGLGWRPEGEVFGLREERLRRCSRGCADAALRLQQGG